MIRFFVSSTFADMQKERDYLQRVIAPELEKTANEHYETVMFEDFRWGIDTSDLGEEEHNSKVLKTCLDEVENCRPYLIIMVGGRYGSSVSTSELKEYEKRYETYEFSEDGLVSLTELEIVLGTKQFTSFDKCVLCLREDALKVCERADADLSADEQKLKKLILSLKAGNPKHCITYADIDEFGVKLTNELQALFLEEYKQPQYQSQVLKAIKDFEFRAHKIHERNYADSSVYDYEIAEEIEDGDYEILALYGASGCGKSYALNRAYFKYKDHPEYGTLMYFCDGNRYARNTKAILITAIAFLEDALGKACSVSYESEEGKLSLKEKFGELIEEYGNTYHKKLLIFVDSFEQLKSENENLLCNWIPKDKTDYFKVIVTWTEEELPLLRKSNEVHFGNHMFADDARVQIAGYEQFRKKTIPNSMKEKMVELATEGNALTLALLLMRMDLMDEADFAIINQEEEQRNAYFSTMIETFSGSENMCMALMEKANQALGIAGIEHAFAYLALSRSGLRECDLRTLLRNHGVEWNTFDFSYLRNSVSDMFTEGADGEINFSHELFRDNVKQMKNLESYAANLREYLLTLPVEDFIFRENIFAMMMLGKDYSGVSKYLSYLSKRYHLLSQNRDIDGMDDLSERDFLDAVLAIVSDTKTKYTLMKDILLELDTADEENVYQVCRYLSQVLDIILTNRINVNLCRTCMLHIRDYCKQATDIRMKEFWLCCEIGAAYSYSFEGEYENAKAYLKKCKIDCENYYRDNPESKVAFNVYFLWMGRILLTTHRHAEACAKRGNEQAKKKAILYYHDARQLAKIQYEMTMQFLKVVEADDILWKLYNVLSVWRASILNEEPMQLGILLKAAEEYVEKIENIITKDSKVDVLKLLDSKLLVVNAQIQLGKASRESLLNEMRKYRTYAERVYLYFEDSKTYGLIYRFYQTYYRIAAVCKYEGGACDWDELYMAHGNTVKFLVDYDYLFAREVYEDEYKKMKILFEPLPMNEDQDQLVSHVLWIEDLYETIEEKLQKKIEAEKKQNGKK